MSAPLPSDGLGPDSRDAGGNPAQPNRKAASILAAARELFIDKGFDPVSMEMVARQAPVSKATLYAHFASKEELFTAVVVDEARQLTDEVWQIVTESADVADVLRSVALKFVDIFLSQHAMSLQRAVISVVPRFPAIGIAIFESGPRILTSRLATFLAEAHQAGTLDVPDPRLAALQFLSLVRGDLDIRGLLLTYAPLQRADIEAQIEAGIDIFLNRYAG
ncbi:MAG: TetR family transcriptional regulator [Chelatococcus sp.]|nr:MAG: TetR family transcriptional regulator [Chelatococcus sp.]